jgi:phosphoadenosine phosphosulfate reductase
VSEGTSVAGPPAALLDELADVNARLETAPASKVLDWSFERFGHSLVLAASFQDIVLVDLAVAIDPGIEVIFLDTGFHFPETLRFVDETAERYGLKLTVTHPGPEADDFPCGTERCCELRKVAPLKRALVGKEAWLTALKRSDAATRAKAPIVAYDEGFGLVKINPLATWTEDDISSYLTDHDLPFHPLMTQGYLSIGCAPTTRPVAPGEDPRSGRWAGSGKTECGLHA